MLGEDTSETIGIHDHLVERSVLATGLRTLLENLGGVHVVTESETTASFLSDSELITGDHLDLDTEGERIVDGLLGVVTGRIEDGEKTDEFEAVALALVIVVVEFLVGDGESAKTTGGELLDVGLKTVLNLVGLVTGAELDDLASHALGDALQAAGRLLAVGDLSALIDGVEGLEVEELDAGAGPGRIGERADNASVDGVLVLGTGSVGSEQENVLGREGAVGLDQLLVDGELVGGEGTGLVRAENGDTSEFLNGRDASNDGLVLGELLSTDGERDGQDGRHGNGDATNEQDEDVVEATAVRELESRVQDDDLENDEDADSDQAEGTNLGENLLQVTGGVIVLANERGGATEESVGTSGNDDTLGFTSLASGSARKESQGIRNHECKVGLGRKNSDSREALVAGLLGNREGLASQSGLVDGNVDGFGKTAVGGNDVTDLEGNHITGDEVGRLDFLPLAVTLHASLGSERVHKGLDSVTGATLLVETNGGVDEEQEDDTDEILPVRCAASTVGEGDGDESGGFHDPGERVPHEGEELIRVGSRISKRPKGGREYGR